MLLTHPKLNIIKFETTTLKTSAGFVIKLNNVQSLIKALALWGIVVAKLPLDCARNPRTRYKGSLVKSVKMKYVCCAFPYYKLQTEK